MKQSKFGNMTIGECLERLEARKRALRYEAPETIEPADCAAPASAGRVECGVCGKTFCESAVVDDKDASYLRGERCWSITRRLHCDHCQHIQFWVESVSLCLDGFYPTGQVLIGPGYVRGQRAIARFLRQFPQAAGVNQS